METRLVFSSWFDILPLPFVKSSKFFFKRMVFFESPCNCYDCFQPFGNQIFHQLVILLLLEGHFLLLLCPLTPFVTVWSTHLTIWIGTNYNWLHFWPSCFEIRFVCSQILLRPAYTATGSRISSQLNLVSSLTQIKVQKILLESSTAVEVWPSFVQEMLQIAFLRA